jgi:Ribbon-helix-helix protein, copG family
MTSRLMVYLDPGQMKALRERAKVDRVSVAELIRRSVSQMLAGRGAAPQPPSQEVYARLVGLGSSGEADIADDHDRRLGEALTREHLR